MPNTLTVISEPSDCTSRLKGREKHCLRHSQMSLQQETGVLNLLRGAGTGATWRAPMYGCNIACPCVPLRPGRSLSATARPL